MVRLLGLRQRQQLAAQLGLIALLPFGLQPPDAGAQPVPYTVGYGAVRGVQPDPDRGAVVENLVLARDAATFHLEHGELHLFRPVRGRTVGAVWTGEGRFTMDAPTAVERAQLMRFYEAEAVDRPIRRAVFFFTDAVDFVFPDVVWTPRQPPGDARREIEEALRYVSNGDGWLARDFALSILNDVPGYFYVHVAEDRGEPLMFVLDPLQAEEVSLSQRAVRERVRETVSQFHKREDYDAGRSVPEEALDVIRVADYQIESTIRGNLDFSARATLSIERLRYGFDWIPLTLYSELDVDSIRWADGSPAPYVRPDDSEDLWLDLSSAPSGNTSVTFFYGGDLFDQTRNLWVEMKSATSWRPYYIYGRPATYHMTFRHHERFRVATVGSKLSESEPDDDDMVTSTWRTPEVHQMTFNLGRFTEHDVGDERFPNLTVQVDERTHDQIARSITDLNTLIGNNCWANCRLAPRQQDDMVEQVAFDLRNAFAFFNEVYGRTTVDDFTASEIPYGHGLAYAGLVLLSWSTFGWTSEQGFDEMFRAHEVAHQWWGIGVRPATYHDRWLAEGFSEFSGLWYAARVRGSLPLFMARLEESREEIIDRRDEAAPIWLGTRAGTSRNPDDYALTVYHKGAWVLHMLRVLMTDPNTGSDATFEAMIKDFYTRYFGQTASTEQFMDVVEEHVGAPMGWFFDQWVYGTAIPTYHFSYNLEELSADQHRLTVRVRQEAVPETFQMIVPIYIGFGVQGDAQVNMLVAGPETEAELPILPLPPSEVVFNPFESVLAEVRTERWRD